ncbi:hypothetical protein FHL15_011098 [Xylaria flabelliformis]|uniref:Uncharacterized protein n=1 Tax=Xylaria flabelliformis TaxID=2512241 RepID=A0A553HJ69_9PEZI|nr:hypothetical protein FHL15_011098 [Xylaria flabelliformis]
MEQSASLGNQLRSVRPPQPQSPPQSSTSPHSTPRIANSEPSPEPPHTEELSDSVLSLRFPRPAGNRQLSNWISSSSPDIMQPGSVPDVDPSLTELGYDIIGTDGESQAESVASSFDYQKSEDIQSLAGTDVDTDSSDDEDNTLNETTISDATIVEHVEHPEDTIAAETETLDMVNRSLESPTSLSLSNFSPFTSVSYLDHLRTHEPSAVIRGQSSAGEDKLLLEQEALTGPLTVEELDYSDPLPPKKPRDRKILQATITYLHEKRRVLAVLSSLFLIYSLALGSKFLLSSSSTPRELSTVPVASVPIIAPSISAKTTYSVTTPTPTSLQAPNALQTASSSNGLMFIPFGKDNTQTKVASIPLSTAVCSAELSGRDEIIIKIPQSIKSSWLAKDAILIAVSRGLQDIPTKVSSVDEGFLIQVPLKEAHGVLAVTIATTHKPHINEAFRINFGTYRFTEALDAGKQLVRGFAQKVVDTVNGTTSWVEDTYIPALDVVSKQVCGQTASVSESVLHGLQEATDTILAIPNRVIAQIQQSLDTRAIRRRVGQLQLELAREKDNVRDELGMAMLRSRVNSRLLWLKLQGKTEEHGRYLSKVEVFLKEERARIESARAERTARTKKQIRAWHERDRPVASKGQFWSTMGAWAGLGV